MKINSKDLFNYISNLKLNEKVKFKVWYDDCYITEIFWDGENFNWESRDFTSGAFFDSLFDFEIIEEDKKIEKLKIKDGKITGNWENGNYYCYTLSSPQAVIVNKLNELVDEVNKLKENK
jgi:hypothetical protein